MELLRYIPVSAMRWFLWRRATLLVLCVLTVVVLGIFQTNLKTDREKLNREINILHTARLDEGARAGRGVDGVLHADLRRLQSLVLVDGKKSRIHRSSYSDDRQPSSGNTNQTLEDGDTFQNRLRKVNNEERLIKEPYVDKIADEKERGKSHYLDDDININKTSHERYNAEEKESQLLMDELYKLLSKLEKEGIDKVDLEKELISDDGEKEDEQNPFDPLHYPQRINVEKIVKTFVKNGDLPSNPINEWKYTPIIDPSSKCENSKNGVFLLFIVKTKPDNFLKRKTIRKTWADEKRFPNIRTVFSIGIPRDSSTIKKIKLESLKYKDVLLMDYMDTYHNLTLKTTSGINWAVARCAVAEFVVSVDDDMYVATDFLLQHLKDMPQAEAERLYHGHLYHDTSPVRHGEKDEWHSKWIVTKEEYPFDTYPDYIFGGFIIMSMRTVLEMSLAIPYTKPINMEDVYLGIVASRLGIVATNTDLVDFYITYSNTEKFKTLIASHYYTSTQMLKKAWECHLSIVGNDVEKSVFCSYLKKELEQLKKKVNEILDWIDLSNNAL
ncbi:lactosylceramide 1,3-N-acetyl-beta-D-glucosaminyltransferase B-like [Mizuhopecten yessoensis]|uniref:Beta-1,3-galactosyltransferase brn n=1 Tax=Mizuhopecten yessoensis TaxID=6573 RepID=A0A210PEA8_MIZYE|nr:lactosylceramide 1,3-N-acetyl-beta-D-glucosaminyltransferase B-like [Mizuhopecten yessoensis]OWF34820.1 Beta-1,3-galactosyltransferase brn [Mizuhopecten yessoensis]